jgi:hypothetical protein
MRTAWEERRVWMAWRPAARMVSPDSEGRNRKRGRHETRQKRFPFAQLKSETLRGMITQIGLRLTNKIDDSVGHSEGAGCLDRSSDVLHLSGLLGLHPHTLVDLLEQLPTDDLEARNDPLAGERVEGLVGRRDGDLDLESALSEVEGEKLGDKILQAGLKDDVLSSDTERNRPVGDEARDVRGGEEDADERQT